jgi:hypothetical protein
MPAAIGKLDLGRRMIARVLPASYLSIHAGGDGPPGGCGAEQQMVNVQVRVTGPGVPEVVLEGVDALAGVTSAHSVGPAWGHQIMECRADLRPEQRIVGPALRLVDVELGRHDVVVTRENHLLARGQQLGCMCGQAFELAEFVVELRPGRRIAVGQVEAADQGVVHCRLGVAAACVVGVARQVAAGHDRFGASRENGDAIPALLTLPYRPVAGLADRGFGESLVLRFELLQVDHVGSGLREPGAATRGGAR